MSEKKANTLCSISSCRKPGARSYYDDPNLLLCDECRKQTKQLEPDTNKSSKKTQQKSKKPIKSDELPICEVCGAEGDVKKDGGLFLCHRCREPSDSEPEPAPETNKKRKASTVVKKPVNIQHLTSARCDWCDKDGFMYVRENFLCHACIEWEKEEASDPEIVKPAQKRKVYDAKEVERYKKKMKELDIKPVEWKEHDMVKIDADGDFVCADPEKAKQFKKVFKEQEDTCLDFGTVFLELEPEDAEAMNFQFKHTIAKAANIVSNHIADTLGLKKQ